MDYKKLADELTKMLPEKIPYGELVGAPWPYTGQGKLVYEEPENYLIEQAATAITELLERAERAEKAIAEVKQARDFTRPSYAVDDILREFYKEE